MVGTEIERLGPEDYAALLGGLLPSGPIWGAPPGSDLAALLDALGTELARVHGRAIDLVEEGDWRTTTELLAAWESVAGLPDACTGIPLSTGQARAVLLARMTAVGGQSRAYYIELALRALGRTILIEEPVIDAWIWGDAEWGEEMTGDGAIHVWVVHAESAWGVDAEWGGFLWGDILGDVSDAPLECLINALKPAHTQVYFIYDLP